MDDATTKIFRAAVRPIAWRGLALQERSMYGL